MDPSIAGLIGVGIGAMASLLGAFISNWLLVRNQKDQRLHYMKAEKERWLRDKLQEIYSNCIYYLGANFHVLIPNSDKPKPKRESRTRCGLPEARETG